MFFCIKKFQNALFKPLSGLEKKRQWAPIYIKNIKLTKIALHIRKKLSREDTPLGLNFYLLIEEIKLGGVENGNPMFIADNIIDDLYVAVIVQRCDKR